MLDSKVLELVEITERETVEFLKMAEILSGKKTAVAALDTRAVEHLVTLELEQMNKIRSIEAVRAGILKSLSISGKDLNNSLSLKEKIGEDWAEKYSAVHRNFKIAYSDVQSLNTLCKVLLVHSLAFIKQNIRILTEDGRRKLVDKKA